MARELENHVEALKRLVGQADGRTRPGYDPDTGEEVDSSDAAFLRELANLLEQQAEQLRWEAEYTCS